MVPGGWTCGQQASGHLQALLRIFLITFLLDRPANAVESLPNVTEGRVKRGQAEAQIVGVAEIGNDIHFLNQYAVDAVTVRMADAHMRAAYAGLAVGSPM